MAEMTISTTWKVSVQGVIRNEYSTLYHPEMTHGQEQSSVGSIGKSLQVSYGKYQTLHTSPASNEAITHFCPTCDFACDLTLTPETDVVVAPEEMQKQWGTFYVSVCS